MTHIRGRNEGPTGRNEHYDIGGRSNVPRPRVDGGSRPEPLSGHAGTCLKCGKGTMVTLAARSGEHQGKQFLCCGNWRDGNGEACRHAVWPRSA